MNESKMTNVYENKPNKEALISRRDSYIDQAIDDVLYGEEMKKFIKKYESKDEEMKERYTPEIEFHNLLSIISDKILKDHGIEDFNDRGSEKANELYDEYPAQAIIDRIRENDYLKDKSEKEILEYLIEHYRQS